MKMLYCWRCQIEVPMLDEEEYRIIRDVDRDCARAFKEAGSKQSNAPFHLKKSDEELRSIYFAPLFAKYTEITGFSSTVYDNTELLNHRLSNCGPMCKQCNKPLRTNTATKCTECGATQ